MACAAARCATAAAEAAHETTPAAARPPRPHGSASNQAALIAAGVQGLGDGAPLAPALRAPMERRLGTDLSAVRVHTDARAARASERIGARAFAHGQHVAFGEGQYAPQSTEGRRLIAHELAHTVEQACTPGAARVQGDNGASFTVAEMQQLADDIERKKAGGLQPLGTPAQDPRLRFDLLPRAKTGAVDEDLGKLEWRFDRFVDPKDKYEDVCPTCHQTGAQLREAKHKRDADEKRRKLEAAWPSMHAAQHGRMLDAQESSLADDLKSSRLAATQARLALLDAALALPPDLGDDLLASPTAVIPPELRTHMLMAAQAEVLVDAYVDAPKDSIDPAAMEAAREVWVAYYATVNKLFGAMDRIDDARAARERARARGPKMSCPGGCHGPSQTPATDLLLGAPQPDRLPQSRPAPPDDAISLPSSNSTRIGPLATETNESAASALAAKDIFGWKVARNNYRWTVKRLDGVLKQRGGGGWGGKSLVEQLDYAQGLLERQRDVWTVDKTALKVKAVFYPKNEFEDVTDDSGQRKTGARGIPWNFYLIRKGFMFELHDVTAPLRKDGRSVVHEVGVSSINALIMQRHGPQSIDEIDPPRELFDKLNDRDFFPEGELYWRYPKSGLPDQMTMTAPKPFYQWLTEIGMLLALVGGLLVPMLGGPAALALAASLAGGAMVIGGSVLKLRDMEAKGMLTAQARRGIYWDIALDIAGMLTLGMGKVASMARAANAASKSARFTEAAYFFLKRSDTLLNVANVGVIGKDLLAQYVAIQNSKMSPGEKSSAMQELLLMGALSGGLSFLSVYSGARSWNERPPLHIDADPRNPAQLRGRFDDAAQATSEAAGHTAGRSSAKAKKVGDQITHVDPHTGETHTYQFWDDGRITRCSGPPCPLLGYSLVNRIDDMAYDIAPKSKHQAAVDDLSFRGAELEKQARAAVALPDAQQKGAVAAVYANVRALENDMAKVRKAINDENRALLGNDTTADQRRQVEILEQYEGHQKRFQADTGRDLQAQTVERSRKQAGVDVGEDHHIATRYRAANRRLFRDAGTNIDDDLNMIMDFPEHGQLRGWYAWESRTYTFRMRGHHPGYNDWVEKTMRRNVPWGSPPGVALAQLVATGQRLREIIRLHPDVLHYGPRILPPDLRRVRVGVAAVD